MQLKPKDKAPDFDLPNQDGKSDMDHKVAQSYGVWGIKTMYGKKFEGINRSSFLIDEKGKIIAAWYKISPQATVPEALTVLEPGA